MADTTLRTAPPAEEEPPGQPPAMRPLELARWSWRQLTSMRTALVLLFLLTLGAVPGSLLPQQGVDPVRVAAFKQQHPDLSPWYERLSLFHVFSAPWFAAIYLLLFISLAGCVLPRTRGYLAAIRARPPAAPRNLDRLPVWRSWTTSAAADQALEEAVAALRRERYRVDVSGSSAGGEKGYLKETGNLLFHASLLLLLVAAALGNLFGFKASVLVVEGAGFSNTVSAYDTFENGAAFKPSSLAPFTLTVHDFAVRYQQTGDQVGAPRDFRADIRYTSAPGEPEKRDVLRVNHPLVVDGTKVFLTGNGYAPVFTVRDGTGEVVFSGPVPFLPRDKNNASTGVVKAFGAQPQQLGFEGIFLPTAVLDPNRGPISIYPDVRIPRAVLNAYVGNLGADNGEAQSVYKLDTRQLRQVRDSNGQPLARSLAPGQTMRLPGGQGSIRFDGVRRWVVLQVAHNPGTRPALGAAVLAIGGLMLSLFIRRRRVWVRTAAGPGGRTLVEVAGLPRNDGDSSDWLGEEIDRITADLRAEAGLFEQRGR